MQWSEELEQEIMAKRSQKMTYKAIAEQIGSTQTAVKHKIRRLQQGDNQDRYKHTAEKRELFDRTRKPRAKSKILEAHCGFGGMTEVYSQYGEVTSFDIAADRVQHIEALNLPNVTVKKCDSELEIFKLVADRRIFDVVDIDPYGMPSRYFPHVFALINDGILYITLPMIGVAQINKITIEHYRAFWGVEISDIDTYTEKVFSRLKDYAFMHKRSISLVAVVRLGRIFRLAIEVKKTSLLDIVGLEVNRGGKTHGGKIPQEISRNYAQTSIIFE